MKYVSVVVIFILFLWCLACSPIRKEYKSKHKFANSAQYGNKRLTEKYRYRVRKLMDKRKRQNERENIQRDPLRNRE